jgi:hypothetical protein
MVQKNHTLLIGTFKEIHKCRADSLLFLIGDVELKQAIGEKVRVLGLADWDVPWRER